MSLIFTPGQLHRRAELFHRLGQLTAAGIPLPAAIDAQRQQAASTPFRAPLATISNLLHGGATFGEAVRQTGGWLPAFDSALLQAGEQSGRLPGSFELLADYYRNQAGLARNLLAYLAYPAFLLHFALLIFPIGRLQQFVLGGDWLGYLGQKLLVLVPLYAAVLLGITVFQGSRGEAWRALLERLLHFVPGLGNARRSLALARLAAALEALISAGVSIVEAWDLAASASGSPALRRIVQQSKARMYDGLTPAEMVSQSRAFPAEFASQYHTGEISGQMEESLVRLRDYYQAEGYRKLKAFFVMAAGAVIGLVMLLVAWQVIGFWLRYFQQIQEVIPR